MSEKNENFIFFPDKRYCMISSEMTDINGKMRSTYERADFLQIPQNVTEDTLREDIRKGAVHLKPVLELLKKDKKSEMKNIVVSCKCKEDGLVAISYLAACYASRESYEPEEDESNMNIAGKKKNPGMKILIRFH